jgi:hypothetical protein
VFKEAVPSLREVVFLANPTYPGIREAMTQTESVWDEETWTTDKGGLMSPSLYSILTVPVWDPALENYGPNLGYDYGGRFMTAWLDR